VVPYRVFNSSDRPLSIAIGSEKLWSTFCRVIERPDLETHPDFATNPKRVENRPALDAILAEVFHQRSAADWIAGLHAAGVPCSPVRNFAEVAADAQTALRNMFPVIETPAAGPQRVTGPAVKLSATPASVGAAAPELGEHTASVLGELLGLDPSAIEELADAGIILRGRPANTRT
jgi:crotonobetainyl-CoA:carnitine CoA-transferase CaiB-like acyl-CoA transferase